MSAKQLRDGDGMATILVRQLPVIERAFQLAVDGERLYVDALTSFIDTRGGSYVDAYAYRLDPSRRIEATAARHLLRKSTTSFRFVALFTDDRRRLWVGVSDAARDGDGPASANRFFVIDRR